MPSKFFRVATEGATIDGREIKRDWITQMAASYDRATYGARVWLEHYRGVTADSTFAAHGDVLALEAREVEDGKLALFAQIDPLPALVAMNKAKQKIFTSIEVHPNFAQTGSAYLTGLAVTDSPASLGTEVLKFAAGKKDGDVPVFSDAMETDLGLNGDADGLASTLLAKFSEVLNHLRSIAAPTHKPEQADPTFAVKTLEVLGAADAAIAHQAQELATVQAAHAQLQGDFTALQSEFNALTKKLSTQDGGASQRPAATGAEGTRKADC